MKKKIAFGIILIAAIGVLYWVYALPSVPDKEIDFSEASLQRGEYLVHAGGCISCHIDQSGESAALIGGLDFPTEFGTFYAPNITPDEETGIGGWTAKDFFLALQHGRTSSGGSFVSALPYRSYAGLSDQEILDIAAYIMSQPAVKFVPPENEGLPFWLIPDLAMPFWNKMADFMEGEPPAYDDSDPALARGAYLVRSLQHCGDCHTPRNALGIADLTREFAGSKILDKSNPAIDAQALSEGHWTQTDFEDLLLLGILPNSDFVGGHMGHVIEYNTAPMTDADRAAMAKFFMRDVK